MSTWRFHTPGWVDEKELVPEVHDAWHEWHVERAREFIGDLREELGADADAIPYVDPTRGEVPAVLAEPASAPWEGFPEQVLTAYSRDDALSEVEHHGYEDLVGKGLGGQVVDEKGNAVETDCSVRDRQDEYLEWRAEEVDGVLESVTFVCEGYDYYGFLFNHPRGRQRVVDLYRKWTGDDRIEASDLEAPTDLILVPDDGSQARLIARKGEFNPRNQLNQNAGIVHLSHAANSLGAEIRLAVTSSLPRLDAAGKLVDGVDPKQLMCCTSGGEPSRSSDPLIAAAAYRQVTNPDNPQRFTLTDPIGLYIRNFEHTALLDPDGNPVPRDFWQVERGKDASDPSDPWDSRILRLRVRVPEGAGSYRLGDMHVNEQRLEHPGQLAKLISMHLLVDFWKAPGVPPAIPCRGGCCRDEDGLLHIYRPGSGCPPGTTDEYPGLIAAQRRFAPSVDGAPLAMPASRTLP